MAGLAGAPQDVSLPILEDLLGQGYDNTRWVTNAGATDGPCLVKDGDTQDLTSFVSGLLHAAPIFEKTHVGCKCHVIVSGPNLPDVEVSAFGMVEGTPPAGLSEEPVAEPVEEPPVEPEPEPAETPPAEEKEGEEPVPPKETT